MTPLESQSRFWAMVVLAVPCLAFGAAGVSDDS
jgi:hypothetical protein